ncbi:palmitoyl-acyl carrier protein thioesterase [Quercus suber]|uniref:Palmitoyl-acyl carrier protein thioesterase n=1 Tax=Quercus suber TaxID=58331 RepID=A0AAW0LTR5_QUESU
MTFTAFMEMIGYQSTCKPCKSTPRSILESYNLSVMTLEYRKECGRDSILQSLTAFNKDGTDHFAEDEGVEFDHVLRLEDGAEILRGRTKWMPKIYGEGLKNKLMST